MLHICEFRRTLRSAAALASLKETTLSQPPPPVVLVGGISTQLDCSTTESTFSSRDGATCLQTMICLKSSLSCLRVTFAPGAGRVLQSLCLPPSCPRGRSLLCREHRVRCCTGDRYTRQFSGEFSIWGTVHAPDEHFILRHCSQCAFRLYLWQLQFGLRVCRQQFPERPHAQLLSCQSTGAWSSDTAQSVSSK